MTKNILPRKTSGSGRNIRRAGDKAQQPNAGTRPFEGDKLTTCARHVEESRVDLIGYVNLIRWSDPKDLPNSVQKDFKIFSEALQRLYLRSRRSNWSDYPVVRHISANRLSHDIDYCVTEIHKPEVADAMCQMAVERTKQILAELVAERFDQVVPGLWDCMKEVFVPKGGKLNGSKLDNDKISFTLKYQRCGFEVSVPTQFAVDKKKTPVLIAIATSGRESHKKSYRPDNILTAITAMLKTIEKLEATPT